MANVNNNNKHPSFIVKEITRDGRVKRLFVDLLLSSNKEEYGGMDNPHDKFSRIMLTISDSTDESNKKWASANVNISSPETNEYALVFSPDVASNKIHRAAINWAFAEAQSKERENLPDYFTYKFPTGNFKGLTPGEALQSYPERKKEIIDFRDWLSNSHNMERYPSNKELINAINHALEVLNQEGRIPAPQVKNSYLLWKKEKRTIKRGNKSFLYDIKIEIRYFDDYPYIITIRNTEIIDKDTGSYGKPIIQQIRLSELNFTSLIQKITSVYNHFESTFYKKHPLYIIN